jgi:plasmid stabilization system protein ParE
MDYTIVWSDRALDDIDAIAAFIARDSARYAREVVERIFEVEERLERFPFGGRRLPELKESPFREVFVHSFRVIYRTGTESATVVAVIHGRRQLRLEEL